MGDTAGFLGSVGSSRPGAPGDERDSADPCLERTFKGHREAITSLNFTKSTRQLVSGSVDGCLMLWNFQPQLRAFRFVGHKAAIYHAEFSPTGELIASKRSAFFINDFPPFPLSLSLFFFSLFPFPLADDASALWITLRPRFAPFPPTASDPPTRARAPDGANDPPALVRAPLPARAARETTSRPRAPTVTAGPPPRAACTGRRPRA